MKYALYFLGGCFLAWAAAIVWTVSLFLGAVEDVKMVIQQAPAVIEKSEKVVEDVKTATKQFGEQIDRAKAAIPEVTVPDVDTMKKLGTGVGAAGVKAIKTFSLGIGHDDTNTVEPGGE